MVKSSRDYIKRKLEQSQTHCEYIFQHLQFIRYKYNSEIYQKYLDCVDDMIDQLANLDDMLKEFRKVC